MTAAARRETIVQAIIATARDEALPLVECETRVARLVAEMQVVRVAENPRRDWLYHPSLDSVIVRGSCGND